MKILNRVSLFFVVGGGRGGGGGGGGGGGSGGGGSGSEWMTSMMTKLGIRFLQLTFSLHSITLFPKRFQSRL